MHKLVICVYTTSRQRRAINRARDFDEAQQRRAKVVEVNKAFLIKAVNAQHRVKRWKTFLKPMYRQYLNSVRYATPSPVYNYRQYDCLPTFVTYSSLVTQVWNMVRERVGRSKGLIRQAVNIGALAGNLEDLLP